MVRGNLAAMQAAAGGPDIHYVPSWVVFLIRRRRRWNIEEEGYQAVGPGSFAESRQMKLWVMTVIQVRVAVSSDAMTTTPPPAVRTGIDGGDVTGADGAVDVPIELRWPAQSSELRITFSEKVSVFIA